MIGVRIVDIFPCFYFQPIFIFKIKRFFFLTERIVFCTSIQADSPSIWTGLFRQLILNVIFDMCCVLSHSVLPNSLQPHGLLSTRLLCPWDFPGKNTEMSCHFLLQGIFSTQGSNPCLMYWQVDSLPLCYLGSLIFDMVKFKSIICFLFVLVYLSVQFSCSVMSGSLRPHELQHFRPPCPSPTPRVHPNPCPLSR